MSDTLQNSNLSSNQGVEQKNEMSLLDLFTICVSKWRWYLVSIAVAILLAALYLVSTPNQYTMSATILIKDEGTASKARASRQQFDIMGVMFADANVQNELITIKSPTVMAIVVEKLGLNERYMTKKGMKPLELYHNSPILVSFMNPEQIKGVAIEIVIKDGQKVVIKNIQSGEDEWDEKIECGYGEIVKTPIGGVVISKTEFASEEYTGSTITYYRSSIGSAAVAYAKRLKVSLTNEESTAIDLQFTDPLVRKASDILYAVIDAYNEYWVLDQNQVAVSTSKFIAERLTMIEQELGSVDSDISAYKSEHLLPDIKSAAVKYLEEDAQAKKELMIIMNQKNIASAILNRLKEQDYDQTLPSNSGITNSDINIAVNQYNTILTERKKYLANSSAKNPIVQDLTISLETMRTSVIQSFESYVQSLDLQVQALNERAAETQTQLSKSPSQAKYLLSVERQQKVKEALYIYLLQKLEENEMSQTFIASNTRILTAPIGGDRPSSPHKTIIVFLALCLGVFFPTVYIYLREIFNTKVRGKVDIQTLRIPYLGEIPQIGKNKFLSRMKKNEKGQIVVKNHSRNIANEAFRIVRTNLDFINRFDKSKVFMIISMNPGSGKTFVSMNLAATLAIKGSRTVVLDLDLRKAATSEYVGQPKKGITNYLIGEFSSLDDITIKDFAFKNFDVIPVGTIPPNPTELLLGDTIDTLFTELRAKYDYVLVDCPPIEIIADSSIIAEHADKSIFVIRCGLLDRAVLPYIEEINASGKYKPMSIILNGSKQYIGGKYGYHSYSKSY